MHSAIHKIEMEVVGKGSGEWGVAGFVVVRLRICGITLLEEDRLR